MHGSMVKVADRTPFMVQQLNKQTPAIDMI
jgi:hypothetical protein